MNGKNNFVKHLLAFIVLVCTSAILLTVSVSAQHRYLEAPPEKYYAISSGAHESLDTITDAAALESYLRKELMKCTGVIDISSFEIPGEQKYLNYINDIVRDDLVDLFHVNGIGATISGGYLATLNVQYNMSKAEFDEEYSDCLAVADKILAGIEGNDNLTDVQKALLLHDRLAVHCEYDYKNFCNGTVPDASYTLYGAFVKRFAVCQGYSEAYLYLLSRVGIESHICVSDTLGHEWNIVTIGNNNYHVDVTWDDPTEDKTGHVLHDNFLLSDSAIYATGHNANDYEKSASDTHYDNYFWKNSYTAFQLLGDEIYYVDSVSKTLNRYSNKSVVKTLPDVWYAAHNSFYPDSFTCLASDGLCLYYNTSDSVCRYDIDKDETEVVWQPELPVNGYYYIYGFAYEDNYLICDIFNSPNFNSDTKKNHQQRHYYEQQNDVSVSSVEIYSLPSKTGYYIGDKFSSDGLALKVRFSNGTSNVISQGFDVKGFNSSSEGVNTITAEYHGYKVFFDVKIKKPYVDIKEESVTLEKLGVYTLEFKSEPSDCVVKWESSDISVAVVNQSGRVVSEIKTGTAVIKACIVYNGKEYSDTCTVAVRCAHFGPDVRVEYKAVESTCTVAGHGRYVKCRLCDEILEGSDKPLPLAEHKYENNPDGRFVKIPATCTDVAVYYESCVWCSEKGENTFSGESVDVKNHQNLSVIPPLEPCMDKDGYTQGEKCDDCGRITQEPQVIPAGSEHQYENTVVFPACTQQGYTVYKCKLCLHEEIDDYKDALGHSFNGWTVVTAPTVEAQGLDERVCAVCDEKETRFTDKLEPEKTDFTVGDINGDNKITASDARLALRCAAGLDTLEKLNVSVEVIDYNGDKKITAADARMILRKAAGLD